LLPDSGIKIIKKLPGIDEIKAAITSLEKLQEIKQNNCLSDGDLVPSIFDALIAKDSASLSPIITSKDLLKNFVQDEEGQISLLRCIEKFCGETQPSLLPKVAQNIKQIYDEELLEEDTILSWFGDSTDANSKVRENVAPLIKWFKETENESGEEDEDE